MAYNLPLILNFKANSWFLRKSNIFEIPGTWSRGLRHTTRARWKVPNLAWNRHETRYKRPLGRDPKRSWCHRHTSVKFLWSHSCKDIDGSILFRIPTDFFPVGLPVKILKTLLSFSILATSPAHLNLLDLITLTILGERYKL